jgi:outer membrane protein assembly factor BamD (BamD/ComL family)
MQLLRRGAWRQGTGVAMVTLAAFVAAGCSTGVKEFFGLDVADPAASNIDLKQYHDPLILLGRADKLYDQRNYLEASLTYERFLELHRLHPKADFAQYRLGLSDLKQFRSVDRDIEPVTKALKAFQLFLTNYPDSLYAADVRTNVATCRRYLAESELSIGRFYYRQGTYQAAISRFEEVIKEFGDLPVKEQTLYLLGQAYAASGNHKQARERLEQLLRQYPNSHYEQRAKDRLARLGGPDA